MVGLNDLESLFQPGWFYDSVFPPALTLPAPSPVTHLIAAVLCHMHLGSFLTDLKWVVLKLRELQCSPWAEVCSQNIFLTPSWHSDHLKIFSLLNHVSVPQKTLLCFPQYFFINFFLFPSFLLVFSYISLFLRWFWDYFVRTITELGGETISL